MAQNVSTKAFIITLPRIIWFPICISTSKLGSGEASSPSPFPLFPHFLSWAHPLIPLGSLRGCYQLSSGSAYHSIVYYAKNSTCKIHIKSYKTTTQKAKTKCPQQMSSRLIFISLADCNIDNIPYFQQQQNDRALDVTRSAVSDYY